VCALAPNDLWRTAEPDPIRQQLAMDKERSVLDKLLSQIHSRESSVFGKSGLLKTKLGISAGSKELAAAQSTYGAQLSDKGIDLSADAEMLKEGDKAIQQAQDASALNTQQLVKKLQVTRSKSHVQLKTRRAPTTQLSAAEPIETPRLAQTSTVVAVAPDASPMSKAIHAAASEQQLRHAAAQPTAKADAARAAPKDHGVPGTVVAAESSDIKKLESLMTGGVITTAALGADSKKLEQAEQLLMSSVNAMRKNGDAAKQPPQLKEKEIGLTIDALRLKRLEEKLVEMHDDAEHKRLMAAHKQQMQMLQRHIDAKKGARLSLTERLKAMQKQNAELKKQLALLSTQQKQAEGEH